MRSDGQILSLRGITAGYGRHTVIRGLELAVREGEFVGIAGPNGSGKSTLLRVMTGIIEPSAGEVIFRNSPMNALSPRERARSFGTVFLHRESLPSFTAEQYVRQRLFSREFSSAKEQAAAAEKALTAAGAAEFAAQNIRTLSAGQLQLVSIAGALAQNESVLYLDEPTSHLDIRHSLETAALLERLNRNGTTVIAVFHDINLALSVCSRIIGIADGKCVCDLPPAEFAASGAANALFGVTISCTNDPFSGKPFIHFAKN